MSETPALFPVDEYVIPGVDIEVMRHLTADRARTMRHRMTIASGNHPFGGPLLKPAGETCGTCKHCVVKQYGKRFYKCMLNRGTWTKGPGSDLRKKWPACSRFQPLSMAPALAPKQADAGNAPTLGGEGQP